MYSNESIIRFLFMWYFVN